MEIEIILKMDPHKQRLFIITVSSTFFIIGFVFSFIYYQPLFNKSIQLTIELQNSVSNPALNVFMNIISNLFNPTICAGYILILYLLTARKLEIVAFLIWFLFLSWMISLLKQVYQQPRPFWVNPDVQMLEWNCYTEYGSPSGHSALVIVLLDFLVRFTFRWSQKLLRVRWLLYFLIFCFELLVMFSRVYLGMHSINQVILGLMIGVYSLIPYYLYFEKIIFKFCLYFLSSQNRFRKYFSMFLLIVFIAAQQLLLTYLPNYDPSEDQSNIWIKNITNRQKCSHYNYQTSFFYKCLQDEAIAFGIPALLIALQVTLEGQYLLKKFAHSRKSKKYFGYLAVIIITSLIPVAIFLNPFWKKIQSPHLPLIIWILNSLGFIFGIVSMIGFSSYILQKFGLNEHKNQSYYQEYGRLTSSSLQISMNENTEQILSKIDKDSNIYN